MIDRVALALLLAGLAMKAGAVPMHMWAPEAYGEARRLLYEVLAEGNESQVSVARNILEQLDG